MRWLVVVILLVGCGAQQPSGEAAAVENVVPPPCPSGAAQPAVPKPPRTFEVLVDYANALRRALTITEDARVECARRYNRDVRGQ